MGWFNLLLLVIALIIVYKIVYAVSKRIFAIAKINSLKRSANAKIKYLRSPFASFVCLSKKPDVLVEIGDTVYLLRFISGVGGLYYMHFASENYLVRFTKSRFHLGGRLRIGKRYRVVEHSGYITTENHSVKILPTLDNKEIYKKKSFSSHYADFEPKEQKIVPVLLLNPTPCELSYVTKEKTSIKVAFTGDEVYGQKIFTASTFATFAEREARNEGIEEKEFNWTDY